VHVATRLILEIVRVILANFLYAPACAVYGAAIPAVGIKERRDFPRPPDLDHDFMQDSVNDGEGEQCRSSRKEESSSVTIIPEGAIHLHRDASGFQNGGNTDSFKEEEGPQLS